MTYRPQIIPDSSWHKVTCRYYHPRSKTYDEDVRNLNRRLAEQGFDEVIEGEAYGSEESSVVGEPVTG